MVTRRCRELHIAACVLCMVTAGACAPMVHVATEADGPGGPTPADQVTVDLRLRPDAMRVSVSNLSETPLDVLWDKASLVDTDGNASAVVRSNTGDQWAAPDLAADVSRIPAHGTLTDYIIPSRNVVFGADSGWFAEPLLPVECGPLRCVGYHELVGKTVRLSLPMQVNGTARVFDWTLRITDAVKSVRGGRPHEAAPP